MKKVGESASVDREKVRRFVEEFEVHLREYSPDQIFRFDPRFDKQRVSILLGRQIGNGGLHKSTLIIHLPGGNAAGTLKLKPVFIHKTFNPRDLPKRKESTACYLRCQQERLDD